MRGCVQHTCCATMFAAPAAAAFALSRSSRLASLSKAHTVPLPPIKATKATEQPRQNPKWQNCISLCIACTCISESRLHKRGQLPRHRLKNMRTRVCEGTCNMGGLVAGGCACVKHLPAWLGSQGMRRQTAGPALHTLADSQ